MNAPLIRVRMKARVSIGSMDSRAYVLSASLTSTVEVMMSTYVRIIYVEIPVMFHIFVCSM